MAPLKPSLAWITCLIVITVLVTAVLWRHSAYPIGTILTKTDIESYEEQGTYVLTAEYVGQQGAGIRGLLSQQYFFHHWDIPVSIVEPFLIHSELGHMKKRPQPTDLIKFSDLFNIHTFNAVSRQSGYTTLATWEDFLSNAQEKTILVELQPGNETQNNTVWETDTAPGTSCYNGEEYSVFKQLVNCTICIVRVVTVCCIESAIPPSKSTLTVKELQNAFFGIWKPEEVNLLFTYWSAYWGMPSGSHKTFDPVGNLYSSLQLVKQANEYKDLYMKSNQSTIAFVLRFEYLLLEHYDIDACMNTFYETLNHTKIVDKSVFVAADIGKYRSNSWEDSLSEFSSKKASQYKLMERFHDAVSLLIGDQWTFEDWDNSFTTVTAGIEANGYIAALQKTIASRADCIYFLVQGGNFQSLVVEEYVKHHPHQTEPCINFICDRTVLLPSPAYY